MEKFNIRLAGRCIGIECRYEAVKDFFKDYITDETEPEITVSADDGLMSDSEGVSPDSAEIIELYRPIAEAFPGMGGFVFHGAAISYKGVGYIFTAPSGTGKSTHIREWKRYLGRNVDIVNGDKPIITVSGDGVSVHGTPWAGKERWQKNRSVPLGGICFLERGTECEIKEVSDSDRVPMLFSQTYRPHDPDTLGQTIELIGSVGGRVPMYSLRCDVSEDAVKCAFEMMCGADFAIAKSEA